MAARETRRAPGALSPQTHDRLQIAPTAALALARRTINLDGELEGL
jgi:hypothetical protein